MNVQEFLRRHDHAGRHDDRPHVDLVRFGDNDTTSNYLRLIQHDDGRLDLVDCNCGDTGTDCRDSDLAWLKIEIEKWLDCVCDGPEDRDSAELFQIDA